MLCEFEDCNIADDYWVECKHCGRRLDGLFKASKINDLGIQCQEIKPKQSEQAIVNWVGVVEYIKENTFTAKLIDKSDDTTYEMADFDFDEVAYDERNLISIGTIFDWSVTTVNLNSGVILSTSVLRFLKPGRVAKF